jgi:hypothetical protein
MPAPQEAPAVDRRRFARAAVAGSLVALVPAVAMLLGPGTTLARDAGLLGGLYDVQGRAFLDGHLDVDPGKVAIEGFETDGRTYLYFGPVPALLRLPVLLVTHGLDQRLTQLSMLLALGVLLAAGAWLHWAVRRLLRPAAPVDRTEAAAVALTQVALGAGAVPLYLLSRPVVYHETELWGAAFAVAALAAIVGVVREPESGRIALAGLLATLAVNTRVSVGLAPIAALAILAAIAGWRIVRAGGARGDRRALAALVLAAAVPLAVSAAINFAKFERPFGIPLERQAASRVDPQRRAALAANPDGLFGTKFVPTTLVQALRPDAVGTARAFPFVGPPSRPAHVFGDVRFDTIERSLSAPTSMPLFCVLALVGIVALVRRRDVALLGVLAGSAAGFAVTLTIAYVTTRYLADLLPCLLLGAVIGLQALIGRPLRRSAPLLGAIAALTLAGAVTNGSVGLLTQRLVSGDPTTGERASFVRAQDAVDRFLGRDPRGVLAGPRLPPPGPGRAGDLFDLDGCAGLYARGLQGEWLPVERTARAGLHRLEVRFPSDGAGRPRPLLTLGSGPRRVTVLTAAGSGGRRFSIRVGRRTVATGAPVAGPGGRAAPVRASFDRYLGRTYLNVRVGTAFVVTAPAPYDRGARRALGTGVRETGDDAPTCRRLARRAGRAA